MVGRVILSLMVFLDPSISFDILWMSAASGGLYSSVIQEFIAKPNRNSCGFPPLWDLPGCALSLCCWTSQALPASLGEVITNKSVGKNKLEIVSKWSILMSQSDLLC